MLIGFIGTPASGKTTVATQMFASFKGMGTSCELIVEQARQYIAKMRYDNKFSPEEEIVLTDQHQVAIAAKQLDVERNMKFACPISTIIISDSSVLNSFLYMTKEYAAQPHMKEFYSNVVKLYDLLLFCHPVDLPVFPADSNRVHKKEEVEKIQVRANAMFTELQNKGVNIVPVLGSQEMRLREASSSVLNRHCELVTTL